MQADLAVNKKKVSEVQQWMEFALSPVRVGWSGEVLVPLHSSGVWEFVILAANVDSQFVLVMF